MGASRPPVSTLATSARRLVEWIQVHPCKPLQLGPAALGLETGRKQKKYYLMDVREKVFLSLPPCFFAHGHVP
jgi:hypothetical protein